jgi:hypothetical protein
MNYEPKYSVLAYGGPGAGKTATFVSAFWDWKRKEQIANGRLITFGRENNPALMIPDVLRMAGPHSLRFAAPSLDNLDWLSKFEDVVDGLLLEAQKGKCLDVLVVDGMTEFDLLFEAAWQKVVHGDKWDKFDDLLNRCFAAMTRLDHEALNCLVMVTARVMEKKKSKQAGNKVLAGDPNFIDFDYYPSMRGSFRLHFPHYFNLVLYMETRMMRVTEGERQGQTLPAHVLSMVRTGEFYVKNQWESDWLRSGQPTELVNPMWPDVHERLVASMTKENDGTIIEETGELVNEV